MPAKKPSSRRPRVPSPREIEAHKKKHAEMQRLVARVSRDLDKIREGLPEGGSLGGTIQVVFLKKILDFLRELLAFIINWFAVCNALYDAMSATVSALSTPGLPTTTRDELNKQLDRMIQDAARLGCG